MKSLQSILFGVALREVVGTTQQEVTSIQIDSRKIIKGAVFVAIKGLQADGHSFIPTAIEKGATVIVCENKPDSIVEGLTYIMVENAQEAATLQTRLNAFEISPSAPLAGPGVMWGEDCALPLELNAIAHVALTQQHFLDPHFQPSGSRRPLRIALTHPQAEAGVDEHGNFVRVAFDLPKGAYATSVLQELFGGAIIQDNV